MENDIVVRPITENDAGGFRDAVDAVARERRFLRRFQGPSLENALGFVRSNLQNGNPQFVALSGPLVVGWCDIVRGHEDGESHLGELGMGVLADWRGRGIGRWLMTETLRAADAGFLRVELSVHADNGPAINLYRSLGFVHEGTQSKGRTKPGGFVDVLLMARLQPAERWV
jgi:ribosomal protein S18 acetylase RimI-like enzyme